MFHHITDTFLLSHRYELFPPPLHFVGRITFWPCYFYDKYPLIIYVCWYCCDKPSCWKHWLVNYRPYFRIPFLEQFVYTCRFLMLRSWSMYSETTVIHVQYCLTWKLWPDFWVAFVFIFCCYLFVSCKYLVGLWLGNFMYKLWSINLYLLTIKLPYGNNLLPNGYWRWLYLPSENYHQVNGVVCYFLCFTRLPVSPKLSTLV